MSLFAQICTLCMVLHTQGRGSVLRCTPGVVPASQACMQAYADSGQALINLQDFDSAEQQRYGASR
jgi:hypothetical protein